MTLVVDNPHLAFPLALTPDGTQVVVNEQDSIAEIEDCVQLIAQTDISLREDRTDFGWEFPDLATIPVDVSNLAVAIERLEPRVSASVNPDATPTYILGDAIEDLSLTIQVPIVDASTQSLL